MPFFCDALCESWYISQMRVLNVFLLGLFLLLQYRLWAGEGSVADIVVLDEKIEQQNAVNQDLHKRNAQLIAQVISLHEDYDSIEEYARSELGLIKADETFYLLVP